MKWIKRILWGSVIVYLLFIVVIAFTPQKLEPGEASLADRRGVQEKLMQVRDEIPNVRINKVEAKQNHVIAVFAGWTGDNPPSRKDRHAWNEEADKVALVLARDYLEEPWQVNVSVWYRSTLWGLPWGMSLPLGIAGRAAGTLEGGPGPNLKNYPKYLDKKANEGAATQ